MADMADEEFTPEELELLDEMIANLKSINRLLSNSFSAGEKNSSVEPVLIDLPPIQPSPSEMESTRVMEQNDEQIEDPVDDSRDLVKTKWAVQLTYSLNNDGLGTVIRDQLLQPFVPINQQTKCTSSNFVPGVFISNCLLDLYTKCGSLVDAQKVTDEMGDNDLCPHWVIMTGLDSIEPLLAQTNEHQLMMLTPVAPRLPPKPPDISYCTVGFPDSSHSGFKMHHSVIPIYRPFLQSLFSQSGFVSEFPASMTLLANVSEICSLKLPSSLYNYMMRGISGVVFCLKLKQYGMSYFIRFGIWCMLDLDNNEQGLLVPSVSGNDSYNCPNQKEAYAWYDDETCLFYYSDHSKCGVLIIEPWDYSWDGQNEMVDHFQFNRSLINFMDSIIKRAASGDFSRKYATASMVGPNNHQPIYGLVQGRPDLSGTGCSGCLHEFILAKPRRMATFLFVLVSFVLCGSAVRKECTNFPTQSHTFRYELLTSKNETWKQEVMSHYHLTPTDDSAWEDMLPRRFLREDHQHEWSLIYRKIKNLGEFSSPQEFLKEVPLQDLRLQEGSIHAQAQITNLEYLLMLDVDRLIWSFRKTAGLPTPSTPYRGWDGAEVEPGGHFVGHYLSASALMWVSTQNGSLKEKMLAVVAGLSSCQEKIGTGYLSAFPSAKVWQTRVVLHGAEQIPPLLIQWEGTVQLKATWEDLSYIVEYHNFNLEDKVDFYGGGNVTNNGQAEAREELKLVMPVGHMYGDEKINGTRKRERKRATSIKELRRGIK